MTLATIIIALSPHFTKSTMTFLAACIQNTATRNIQENIDEICARIDDAVAAGADFIAVPETVGLIEPVNTQIPAATFSEEEDIGLAAIRERARQHQVVVLLGSQLIRDEERIVNRSFMLDRAGNVLARYDKLHLFDIELANGESYLESEFISPGDRAVVVDTELGRFGLSVCYDLRFPQLYRGLAQAGAQILTIPAAFTYNTGKKHWNTLVQARAIETGCFVLAPNQCGLHVDKRRSWGHSMIVDPWGEILAEAGDEPTIIYAEIDLQLVNKARSRIPSLTSGQEFDITVAS